MDESYGGFGKDIHYVGHLLGSDLVDGARFRPDDSNLQSSFRCGIGNRVNLYINNNIDYIDTDPPQYGLIFRWQFTSFERQVVNADSVEDFWPVALSSGQKFSARYNEMLPEFADAAPSNPHVKSGGLSYKFLALPNKQDDGSEGVFSDAIVRPYLVVPIVALADYLSIWFYSQPEDHSYQDTDEIQIWAAAGHDSAGGNFPYK